MSTNKTNVVNFNNFDNFDNFERSVNFNRNNNQMKLKNFNQRVIALVLTFVALLAGHTTALADETVSLSEDPDIAAGTAGHWYVNMHRRNNLQLTFTTADLAAGKGTFKVYDDGGKNGNYSPGCGSSLIITVPEGYILQASGTVWTKNKNNIDELRLYNSFYYGDNTLASVQSDADGEGKDFGPVVTSKAKMTEGQYLRLYFLSSTNETTYAGFDVTVTVIENTLYNVGIATGIAHGSVSVSPAQARYKDEVTITATPDADYYLGTVSYNDGTGNHVVTADKSGAYKFTMPQSDVTVSATFLDETGYLWGEGNDGSAEHPYVIRDKEGYDLLVEHSKTNSYADKHFELTDDISDVTTMIASEANYPFCGIIDGKGHKVTLALSQNATVSDPSTNDSYGLGCAMIHYAGKKGSGCTISNLTVSGTITTTCQWAAGFISYAAGTISMTDCRSSVTINSTRSGTSYDAGFVSFGRESNSKSSFTFTRCLFDGAFISDVSLLFSGFLGKGFIIDNFLKLENCVVAPDATTHLQAGSGYHLFPYAYNNEKIVFSGYNFWNKNGTIDLIQNQGTQTYQLTLNDGATAVHSDTGTAIGNGAATVYADGFSYGGNAYFPQGTTVTLGNTPADGMTCIGYTSSGTTISDAGTFTMPANTVIVGAHYQRTDYVNHWQASLTRDGSSEQKAFLITTPEGLNLLASEVNGGNTFEGKFFKLDADITYSHTTAWNDDSSKENNYAPIGSRNNNLYFSGTFDGQNHTVSGIRYYKETNNGSNIGLFGQLKNGTVKNVTLADARLASAARVGGIVGFSLSSVVDNCYATETVTIRATRSNTTSFGGIVGSNDSGSTVSRCTSAARIMAIDGCTGINSFGGIVGSNSIDCTVSDCTAAGAIIANVEAAGAIVGHNNINSANNTCGILTGNTYHSCLVGTNAFNIGVGFHGTGGTSSGEYGDRTGATLDRTKLFLFDDRNNTDIIAAYSAPTSHTAYSGTAPSVSNLTVTLAGRTLYKDGDWNTLCLPFNLSISGSVLDGDNVDVRTLSSTEFSNGTLTLNFTDKGNVTIICAGVPYIIKWDNTGSNLVNPTFSGVTISNTTNNVSTTYADFKGTYSPIVWETENTSILFVGGGNTLYYPQSGAHINAQRAYFQLKGITAGDVQNARMNVDDDDVTGIQTTDYANYTDSDAWYDMSGRKLDGKPTQAGLYIHNGNKVVIK